MIGSFVALALHVKDTNLHSQLSVQLPYDDGHVLDKTSFRAYI